MQLRRAPVDRSLLGYSKQAPGKLAHFPRQPRGIKEEARGGQASEAREEGTVASSTVALYLARFYGKTCCHATLAPCWGQTVSSLRPAAWRDSECLSYVYTGICVLFVTDRNASAPTSCSALCPERFLPSGLPPGSPQLASCPPHTVGERAAPG